MSLPLYAAAAVPIAIILILISIWWDRRWRLRNVPSPVGPQAQGGACFVSRNSPPLLTGWCLSCLGTRKDRVRRRPRLAVASLVQRMRQGLQDERRLGPPGHREHLSRRRRNCSNADL